MTQTSDDGKIQKYSFRFELFFYVVKFRFVSNIFFCRKILFQSVCHGVKFRLALP